MASRVDPKVYAEAAARNAYRDRKVQLLWDAGATFLFNGIPATRPAVAIIRYWEGAGCADVVILRSSLNGVVYRTNLLGSNGAEVDVLLPRRVIWGFFEKENSNNALRMMSEQAHPRVPTQDLWDFPQNLGLVRADSAECHVGNPNKVAPKIRWSQRHSRMTGREVE